MSMDPKQFDLMRIVGLKPKQLSEEEKRYPVFNTRMLASTVDMLLITMTLSPIVDMVYHHYIGEPPVRLRELQNNLSHTPNSADASHEFIRIIKESGFWDYWLRQMSWHIYVIMAYMVLCWHFWSATPGKMLFRLVVVDAKTYKPLGDWQSIIRAFGYLIALAPFGLGIIWIALDKKKRGWHDILAGTVVMKKSAWKKLMEEATSTTAAAHPSGSPAPSEAE